MRQRNDLTTIKHNLNYFDMNIPKDMKDELGIRDNKPILVTILTLAVFMLIVLFAGYVIAGGISLFLELL